MEVQCSRSQEETMVDRKHANRNVSLRLKKYTQMKKRMEDPQSSAAGGSYVDGQVEELRENRMPMVCNEERERKMKMGGFNNGDGRKNVAKAGGVYDRDTPPVDDCCPICLDDFHIPCRTSCGHWYCANCILQLWKYMANFKQCKCPICGSLIFNVVPHSSVLIQREEVVIEVLKEIKKYNSQNMVGWFGIFMKALAMPLVSWRRFATIFRSIHLIGLLLHVVYETYDFQFFPHGEHGIRMLFTWFKLAVLIFAIWRRCRPVWRDRHWLNRMQ